jgi:hypothetical protein
MPMALGEGVCRSPPADLAQQRVLANGQHQPVGQASARPAAESETEVPNQKVEPCGATCRGAATSGASGS